jgi:Flp pilus assembly protein TadD
VNCNSGDVLAEAQQQAAGKELVLKALDSAALSLRGKLGESLKSVQKYATPLDEATTPSLEALQAYTLAVKALAVNHDNPATVAWAQRAVHLDPNFGIAYNLLGVGLHNLGELNLAADKVRKAYELRERVSEHEKFNIESGYYNFATGDLEKARQSCELWAQTYPRDDVPHAILSNLYWVLGQYDKGLADAREAVRLNPASGNNYENLAVSYFFLNRVDEARVTIEEAWAKKLDTPFLHLLEYNLAFLRNDSAGMAQQMAWVTGKRGIEDVFGKSDQEQMMLFADRTSTSWLRSNQIRIYFSTVAYLLMQALRRLGLAGTELAKAQCNTVRLKLLKIGAQIRITVRKIWVSLSTGYPYLDLFRQVHRQLQVAALRC